MNSTAFNTPPISFSLRSTNFFEYDPLTVEEKRKRRFTKRQPAKNNPLLGSKFAHSKPSEKGSMTDNFPIPDTHGSCSLDLHEPVTRAVTISGSDAPSLSGMVLLHSNVIY